MPPVIDLTTFVQGLAAGPLAAWQHALPWELTARAPHIVRELLAALPPGEFVIEDEVAVHRSAVVEGGATLKGPLIVGAGCLVAAGAYLRGGNWVDAGCTIGPGAELKSSFVLAGSVLAHFNFVGDSVLGRDVNLEAGSIVCNHRNERTEREVHVRSGGARIATGQARFGALIGDGCRIGANAVLAPGVLLAPGSVVERGRLIDQDPQPQAAA